MARRRTLLLVAAAAALASLLGNHRSGAAPPPFRVIVNAAHQATVADRKLLTDAFLKRITRWPGGELIRPVDLSGDSAVRRRFSEEVLGRSVAAVKSHWQQMIFAGRAIPPPELDTDDEVIRYVARHAGAVGYVSGVGDLAGVKVLAVR